MRAIYRAALPSGGTGKFHPHGDELLFCLQRPARSQISTAVSFEPVHPANSAANVAQSGEDSAASAAEPEGEDFAPCDHLQQKML